MTRDPFTRAYLECALWSSTGDDDAPLDRTFDLSDFAPEALEQAIRECEAFRESAGAMLEAWSDEQAGHDFWLTRNGHGAGFWDRDFPFGRELSELARKAGERDCYAGDDGRLYFSP